MSSIIKLLLILFLRPAPFQGSEFTQLRNLSRIVHHLIIDHKMETILILKHHLNNNCSLQHWNPHGIAVIRTDDLKMVRMKDNYNSRALAIICIGESSHINLLNHVADAFENMRQQRIILWTQVIPTVEFLEQISQKSKDLHFLNLIVLKDNLAGAQSCHRLNPFPSAHFDRIENICTLNGSFFKDPEFNFQGKTATVKHDLSSQIKLGGKQKNIHPVFRIEDWEIIEFAQRYNLTLQLLKENGSNGGLFDLQLKKRFMTKNDSAKLMDYVNPFCASTLLVAVPCGSHMSFQDVLKHSGLQKWFLYISVVYIVFVLIEVFILKITFRIFGPRYRQTTANLYAFRAILGLPFPEPQRSSLSIRQLFLAIVIFGMVFSNFINCQLSSMLTKPHFGPQVTNFKELQESGLVVLMDEVTNHFIKTELSTEFNKRLMTRIQMLPFLERVKLVYSCNGRYALVIFSDNWHAFDVYQRSKGVRAYCTSEGLTIAENLPRMQVLGNNSIYQYPLSRFIMLMQESGITNYWIGKIPQILEKNVNQTIFPNNNGQANALSLEQLKWLWYLLILGYSTSLAVFFGELLLKKRIKRFWSWDSNV